MQLSSHKSWMQRLEENEEITWKNNIDLPEGFM